MVRVKICGLRRQEDAELAIDLGADALGFNFEPTSPRFIPSDNRHFIDQLEPYAHCVAVYAKVSDASWASCNSIQCIEYGASLMSPPVFKVVRPQVSDVSVVVFETKEWIHKFNFVVRGILLDAFDPNAFGGTGNTVDWDFAAEFVKLSPKPVILAGGLNVDNVGLAITKVRPYAVDVSSGIESSPGIKDPIKMRDFIQAAKQAGQE